MNSHQGTPGHTPETLFFGNEVSLEQEVCQEVTDQQEQEEYRNVVPCLRRKAQDEIAGRVQSDEFLRGLAMLLQLEHRRNRLTDAVVENLFQLNGGPERISPLEREALKLSFIAHDGETRRYENTPYIDHPRRVASIVRSVRHDNAMLAAAWGHDLLENTSITAQELECLLGSDAANLIEELTDPPELRLLRRSIRHSYIKARLAGISKRAKTVKLADIIDNTRLLKRQDPKFAEVYFREKREILEILTDGDLSLWRVAFGIVNEL